MNTKIATCAVAIGSATIVWAVLAWQPSPAAAASNWEQIKSSGKLRMGVVPYPPNSFIDTKTGKWEGFTIDMANDIAKVMGVTAEFVETTFGNSPIDLQANKIDIQFGLQATPLRAMAIDFAGPVYELSFSTINNKNFKTTSWEDYNKTTVKIAVPTGGSAAVAARMFAPKAERVELKTYADTIAAVQAGRADTLVNMSIANLVAKVRNPELGDYVQPKPIKALPSHAGMRFDDDRRFRDFINRWAEFHRLSGTVTDWVKKSLIATGISESDIPDDMQF